MYLSGMDRPVSSVISKAPHGQSRITKSFDPAVGPNCYLHCHSSCGVSGCSETALVSLKSRIPSHCWPSVRYIPPHLDRDKSNIENSQNTALFLMSCYEYILSGIVLSVGPPFRQAISHNRMLMPLSLNISLRNIANIKIKYLLLSPSWSLYYFLRICLLIHPNGWQTSCS